MTLHDIVRRTNGIAPLEPRHWAWARLLGEARTASNDRRRARRSDRGEFNAQVDLLGALGELFLLRCAMAAEDSDEAVEHMRGHLYNEQGGGVVEGPDIEFVDHVTGELRQLDVKTFDCAPNKRVFAINDNKHRLLRGRCSHYLCVITPPFGRRMAVSCLVPWSTVDAWSTRELRPGGSASRNFPIGRFLREHFKNPPSLGELRSKVHSTEAIDLAGRDHDVHADFQKLVPDVPISRASTPFGLMERGVARYGVGRNSAGIRPTASSAIRNQA